MGETAIPTASTAYQQCIWPACHATYAIEEVRKFILQNIDCPLTVRQLAQLARLSEPRLKARFKKELGIPPADYMARQKVDRAMAEYIRARHAGERA